MKAAAEIAGKHLADRLAAADTAEALRRVWARAREKLNPLLRMLLDPVVCALVESAPDADAAHPEKRPDSDVIDLVEGVDYVVHTRPRPTDT